ncbi:MAG: hypothetical protein AVDCRST_MAG64-581 [uncultured Phycisphaerae bacterium]|uniref:Uncharacterized protein n=1 Tax=uncultured Phycisphaerae bacterium TaxID=904963 RepID=A0A6J4N7W0_9BACT|nr:MAG: hypothetical protein AVDCRST_MAG64-581 [uncultured Phycisphaerae bacterium]
MTHLRAEAGVRMRVAGTAARRTGVNLCQPLRALPNSW